MTKHYEILQHVQEDEPQHLAAFLVKLAEESSRQMSRGTAIMLFLGWVVALPGGC